MGIPEACQGGLLPVSLLLLVAKIASPHICCRLKLSFPHICCRLKLEANMGEDCSQGLLLLLLLLTFVARSNGCKTAAGSLKSEDLFKTNYWFQEMILTVIRKCSQNSVFDRTGNRRYIGEQRKWVWLESLVLHSRILDEDEGGGLMMIMVMMKWPCTAGFLTKTREDVCALSWKLGSGGDNQWKLWW